MSQFSESNPLLQLAFDNTSLSAFKDCPRKYYYSIIQGYRSKAPATALSFGSAIHVVYEVFDKAIAEGESRESALRAGCRAALAYPDSYFLGDKKRSRLSLLRSIIWYEAQFRTATLPSHIFKNGRIGLELSFIFPLPFPAYNCETLYYCGHIDKLTEYSNSLFALERKHTVSNLGENFYANYFFSSQIGGYVYAGKVIFETPVSGAIIEATQIGVNYVNFGRAVVHRINSHLEEWMEDTSYWINRIEDAAKDDFWPHNTEACGKYGGCPFRAVCSKAPEVRAITLKNDYRVERWNPLEVRGES